MNAYELEEVTATRDGRAVVSVPEMVVGRGRVAALTGPNGAGKTTLLHLLGFLEPPGGGQVRFFGERVTSGRLQDFRRRVGYLLQNPYLFRLSVLGNVEWGLKARGVPDRQRRDRALAALDRVGLAGYETRPARKLSGGEVQRVALARLLALEPEVILLDEPATHLDPESVRAIERAVERQVGERGATVVMATHDLAQAHRLGATIWRAERGVLRRGRPENVLRGAPAPGESDVFDTGRLRLSVHPLPPEATCVAISPTEIVLSRKHLPSSARNHLEGVLTKAEIVNGEEMRVVADCGEPLEVLITRKSWEELGLTVGDTVVATFKATAVKAY